MAEALTATKIWMALRPRIIAAAGSLPIAWPSDPFRPETTDYLAVTFLPPRPSRITIGGRHAIEGMLSLMLMRAVETQMPTYENTLNDAAIIASAFTVDAPLTFDGLTVTVYEQPEIQGGFREGAWWQVPVIVRWRCFA